MRRERGLIVAAIAALAGLAWTWTLSGAGMGSRGSMAFMSPPSVTLMLAMWWAMMAAMMIPSAAPMILLYGRVMRQRSGHSAIGYTGVFVAGYLGAWLGASAALTSIQLLVTRVGLIDPMTMRSSSSLLSGGTLIAVGVYQVSPIKNVCLVSCRAPASFLARHWSAGIAGAARLGLLHGMYCVGCCWLLMCLLFLGGVMNFLWIVGLTLLVAMEKLVRRGPVVARLTGLLLISWGGVTVCI